MITQTYRWTDTNCSLCFHFKNVVKIANKNSTAMSRLLCNYTSCCVLNSGFTEFDAFARVWASFSTSHWYDIYYLSYQYILEKLIFEKMNSLSYIFLWSNSIPTAARENFITTLSPQESSRSYSTLMMSLPIVLH